MSSYLVYNPFISMVIDSLKSLIEFKRGTWLRNLPAIRQAGWNVGMME